MSRQSIRIPLMSPFMKPPEYDYPITPGENLRRALLHQKPKWMPLFDHAIQWQFPESFQDNPGGPTGQTADGYDWFGTFYKFSEAQSSPTPMGDVFSEIGEWREKVRWPDLSGVDWAAGRERFVRDDARLTGTRLGTSCFERLHAFEGFEQALCDVLLEPEECAAFFRRFTQHRLECIRRLQEAWRFDFLINHDDWSHKLAPFFSTDFFEETLLECNIAMTEEIHRSGAFSITHCCGKMDVWVPYLVEEIHTDALEIQTINDIRAILDRYGDRVTPAFTPDPLLVLRSRRQR